MGQQLEQQLLALASEERAGLVELPPGQPRKSERRWRHWTRVRATAEGVRRPRREISGVGLVQVGADGDALLDDREVLVEREAVDGSVRQLQQLQPVLLSLSHQKKKNTNMSNFHLYLLCY